MAGDERKATERLDRWRLSLVGTGLMLLVALAAFAKGPASSADGQKALVMAGVLAVIAGVSYFRRGGDGAAGDGGTAGDGTAGDGTAGDGAPGDGVAAGDGVGDGAGRVDRAE